ncbi:hypothetical protein [Nocardiopsis halophila]|uniref:hypothetical protein n=1 Tax=Nocardiopsis halophila TaxID=141692 RepID=UPI0003487E97|nr:hypothetical protein [Nocardiopsis halophila]
MTPEQRRQVLAEIARERLIALVYGPITTAEDYAELARLAEAAGVRLADVLPASGEPGADPRTHRPIPAQEPAEEALADDEEDAVALDDDADELTEEQLVSRHTADVAQILGTDDADEAEAVVRRWAAVPARRRAIRAWLLEAARTARTVARIRAYDAYDLAA